MHRLSVLLAFAVLLTGGSAMASPQILGLVATGPEPTELHCRDGVCSARFSSFCLQQSRDAPALGTEYRPADGRALQLVVTDGEGRAVTVPAADATIQSANNYTSVLISVPEATVRALGGVSAALAVAPRTTIVPAAVADDPAAATQAEIARASGPDRAIGEDYVDRAGPAAEAAGVLMTMINALYARDAGAAPRDAAADSDLARAVLAKTPVARAERDGLQERVDLCAGVAANAWHRGGMPVCLESYHDSYMTTLTGRYWDAAATGY